MADHDIAAFLALKAAQLTAVLQKCAAGLLLKLVLLLGALVRTWADVCRLARRVTIETVVAESICTGKTVALPVDGRRARFRATLLASPVVFATLFDELLQRRVHLGVLEALACVRHAVDPKLRRPLVRIPEMQKCRPAH